MEDIAPEQLALDDEKWDFLFVEDITYMVKEITYRENKQTIKHTIAIDLGWYPDGDPGGIIALSQFLMITGKTPYLQWKQEVHKGLWIRWNCGC